MVTSEQSAFFQKNGYLIVRDFLSPEEVKNLQAWAQQVHDYTPTEESDFMPYEVRCQLACLRTIQVYALTDPGRRRSTTGVNACCAAQRTLSTAIRASTTCSEERSFSGC